MDRIYIIIILLVLLVGVYLYNNKKEHAGNVSSSTLSNQAIQNIASVYADTTGTATFNNIRTTGKFLGDVSGNLTGNVTGNVIGDVSGNVLGDVSGNLTGNVIGELSSRILPGTIEEISSSDYTWGNFGNRAASYFKRTDPDGTFKIIGFHDKSNSRIWIVGYIKVGIQILMFKLQEHSGFISLLNETSNDDNWRFVIPA